MTPENSATDRRIHILAEGLQPTQALIRRNRVRRAFQRAVSFGVASVAGWSGIALVVAGVCEMVGVDARGGILILVLAGWMVGGVMVMGFVMVAGRRSVSLREAAERLDLASGNHNCIATALHFSGVAAESSAGLSPFEMKAIDDGLRAIASARFSGPLIERQAYSWRRDIVLAGFSILMAGVAIYLTRPNVGHGIVAMNLDGSQNSSGLSGGGLTEGQRISPVSDVSQRGLAPSSVAVTSPSSPVGSTLSRGVAGQSSESSSNSSASAPSGQATISPSSLPPGLSAEKRSAELSEGAGKPPGPAASASPASLTNSQAKGAPSDSTTPSASNSGGAGAGDSSVAQSSEQPKSPNQKSSSEKNNTKDNAQNAANENAQPDSPSSSPPGSAVSRQDRSPPGSRELGQSALEGNSGNGRGGPSEGKKVRGAGSILMSLPLPDFIPGKMSDGISRITRQLLPPQLASPSPAQDLVIGSGEKTPSVKENLISRSNIPAAENIRATDYLTRLRQLTDPETRTASETLQSPQSRIEGAKSP